MAIWRRAQELNGLSGRMEALEAAAEAKTNEDTDAGSLSDLTQKVNSLEESAWDDHEAMDERVSKLETALASVNLISPVV